MESRFIYSDFSVSYYFENHDSHKEEDDKKKKKFNIVIASVASVLQPRIFDVRGLFLQILGEGLSLSKFACDAELRIPSDLIYLRSVRAFIRELAENLGFCTEKVRNIEIATDEIFSNAVEHGSDGPHSQIVIRCFANDQMIKVTISDKGQGEAFREKWLEIWSNVVSSNIQLGTERGHGLLLTHLLADEMCMKSNSVGGLDVHLLWFIGRDSLYCDNTNRLCREPQVCVNSAKE